MLKSAQVELIEKCNVGGGLVTIAVTGDVGAVQASVEAGASAVQQLGSDILVSRHVIPRPHDDIESIIGRRNVSNMAMEKDEDEPALPVQHNEAAEQMPEQTPEPDAMTDVPLDAEPDVTINSGGEEGFPVLVADLGQDLTSRDASPETDKGDPAVLGSPFKQQIDVLVKESGLDKAMELLETMTAVKLRGLARECGPAYGMSMTTISKANKMKLLKRFRNYYQQ
ncbi:BMC domain-containing protein [Paenibacillus sp. D2_2]|uniref:BMC domain-containing protein n=1 Tax=Paenibacillus sp. D2_2 TaxID=3073092 RepID=UPI0035C1E766